MREAWRDYGRGHVAVVGDVVVRVRRSEEERRPRYTPISGSVGTSRRSCEILKEEKTEGQSRRLGIDDRRRGERRTCMFL